MGRPSKPAIDQTKSQVWMSKVIEISRVESASQLPAQIGIISDKEWYKYKKQRGKGGKCPTVQTLREVEKKLPGTERWFYSGPHRLFEVLETERLKNATQILFDELNSIFEAANGLAEQTEPISIAETPFALDSTNTGAWLYNAARQMVNSYTYYDLPDTTLPWTFAAAYSASRFLDEPGPLVSVASTAINHFKQIYEVSEEHWMEKEDICIALEKEETYSQLQTGLDNLHDPSEFAEYLLDAKDKEIIAMLQIFGEWQSKSGF